MRQSYLADLTYHVFCHMKVDHVSDLYSTDYIRAINASKEAESFPAGLVGSLVDLERIYNAYFDCLGIVQFLPYHANSVEDLKARIARAIRADNREILWFIDRYVEALEKETTFYRSHWNRIDRVAAPVLRIFEDYIALRDTPLSYISERCNEDLIIYLSHSLWRFGRGLGQSNEGLACAVRLPSDESMYEEAILMALHEYTHYITDSRIEVRENCDALMTAYENAVITYDYYLVRDRYEEYLEGYFGMIGGWVRRTVDERNFKDVFPLSKCNNDAINEAYIAMA